MFVCKEVLSYLYSNVGIEYYQPTNIIRNIDKKWVVSESATLGCNRAYARDCSRIKDLTTLMSVEYVKSKRTLSIMSDDG